MVKNETNEIDARLSQFFGADILDNLTASDKHTLNEYSSNYDLRMLQGKPVEDVRNYIVGFQKAEMLRKLVAIQPEEYAQLGAFYDEAADEIDEVVCGKCGTLLAIEIKHKELDANDFFKQYRHHEGKFIIPIGDALLAYRPRLDGVMGYQCGAILKNPEYDAKKAEYDKKVEAKQAERQKELDAIIAKMPKNTPKSKLPKLEDLTPVEFLIGTFSEPEYTRCLNDTRWSEPEVEAIPEDHIMTSLTQADIVNTKKRIDEISWSPKVTKLKDGGRKIESFELRKVK